MLYSNTSTRLERTAPGLMLYVSIFVELLRSRPALAVGLAAAAQAILWTLVPTLFYAGPPGDLPFVLAVGNEWQLGSYLGPPLAFWLAEGAFVLAGHRLFGVYLLSQACVIATYWSVFLLGRSIVGAQHAALAVLLMVGISIFTAPTVDFGPGTLSMALWAATLLHYWRAVGESRRVYWVALAVDIGLLLLTAYANLLLIAVLGLFTIVNRQARRTLRSTDPWLAGPVAIVVLAPHLLWFIEADEGLLARIARQQAPDLSAVNFTAGVRQFAYVLAAHAGLVVLVLLVAGARWRGSDPAPVIRREPPAQLARQFVYFFAIVPPLLGIVVSVLAGWNSPVGGTAALVILSGLAVIVASGDAIELGHQHLVIPAWFAVLLLPPALAVLALVVLPWLAIELNVSKPAKAIATFFSESYQRRLGMPLRIVTGDPSTAALVALGSPSRPSLFVAAAPEISPWVTLKEIAEKGAIVVWPTTDTAGTPPQVIRQRFPDIVPETTRTFERPVAGRLPALRFGWAVIRPAAGGGGKPTGGAK
jgi:4-amino-4-deoxy-L-arabinose transferase-like glycosyltransferase